MSRYQVETNIQLELKLADPVNLVSEDHSATPEEKSIIEIEKHTRSPTQEEYRRENSLNESSKKLACSLHRKSRELVKISQEILKQRNSQAPA